MGIGAQIKNWGGAVLKDAKHALRDEPIRLWLNLKLERYGKMLKLEIDSKRKTISLEILPKGEDKPIQVKIGRYEVIEGETGGLKLGDIQTSREWMTELIKTLAPEPTVPLGHAKLLGIVM